MREEMCNSCILWIHIMFYSQEADHMKYRKTVGTGNLDISDGTFDSALEVLTSGDSLIICTYYRQR